MLKEEALSELMFLVRCPWKGRKVAFFGADCGSGLTRPFLVTLTPMDATHASQQPSKDQSQTPRDTPMKCVTTPYWCAPPLNMPPLTRHPRVVSGDGGGEIPWPFGPNLLFCSWFLRSSHDALQLKTIVLSLLLALPHMQRWQKSRLVVQAVPKHKQMWNHGPNHTQSSCTKLGPKEKDNFFVLLWDLWDQNEMLHDFVQAVE